MARTLVALDFSGTLSLQAALFARPENLGRALRTSGLWGLGIKSPERFWREVVDPTWAEGSTTTKGYKAVMVERLVEILPSRAAPRDRIAHAVKRFVDLYLAHSTIDPAWGPVLRWLQARQNAWIIVATDHYAEATPHIVRQLAALGVGAAPVLARGGRDRLLVASSADLGHLKESAAFWHTVQEALGATPSSVLLVDDFGHNESPLDSYADPRLVDARRRRTSEALALVFPTQVTPVPFLLDTRVASEAGHDLGALLLRYRARVQEVGALLADRLGGPAAETGSRLIAPPAGGDCPGTLTLNPLEATVSADKLNVRYLYVVSDDLASAGQPMAKEFADIARAGYEVVIDITTPDNKEVLPNEEELVRAQGLEYIYIPVSWPAPTTQSLDQFLAAMDANRSRKVFVHCTHNARASAFLLLYRVIRECVGVEEAWRDLEAVWQPNDNWRGFIEGNLIHYGVQPPGDQSARA